MFEEKAEKIDDTTIRYKGNTYKKESGGCFSTIFGLGIIAAAIFLGINFGIGGIIFGLVLVPVAIGIIIAYRNSVKKEAAMAFQKKMSEMSEAISLYDQGKYTLALEKAEAYADEFPTLATLAGFCYYYGYGCSKDLGKAFKFFEKGKESNQQKAVKYLTDQAVAGKKDDSNPYWANKEAMARYGEMLVYGEGCEADVAKGIEYLKRAADSKEPYACQELGKLQIEGEKIPVDIEAGLKNIRIASDEGYVFAKFILGCTLYKGINGAPVDKEQGLQYLNEAANEGSENASEFLKKLEEAGEIE